MTKRNIAKEVLEGLDDFAAWRAGDKKLRTLTVDLPRAADVAQIRSNLGLSQTAFAAFMGVSVGTLRNWEQLRREPQGPARAFLLVASAQPLAVLAAFERHGTLRAPRSATGKRSTSGKGSSRGTGNLRTASRGATRVP
jgi:putative transcriptional regulator